MALEGREGLCDSRNNQGITTDLFYQPRYNPSHRPTETRFVSCSGAFRWEYPVLSARANEGPAWDSEKETVSAIEFNTALTFKSELVLCSVKSQHPLSLGLGHRSQR